MPLNNLLNVYEFVFTYGVELSRVVVTVVKANASTVDSDIAADAKVFWHEGGTCAVLLEDHLALQESTLRSSGVHNFWLSYHD